MCEFGSAYGEWRGHDEIRSGYQIEVDKVDGTDFPFMHAITTPWIELTGENTATGRWLLLEMRSGIRRRFLPSRTLACRWNWGTGRTVRDLPPELNSS